MRRHNRQHADQPIKIVASAGLGTGFDQVAPEEAAQQIAPAYQHFLDPPVEID